MKMIDADAAYRFLTEQLVKETGAFSKGVNKGLNIARSAMRNPDAIPTLTPQNEWVSVEERLPKSIVNKVLVYCENGYIGYGHYEKYQGEETWYNLESGEPFASWNLENCSPYKVTHWMPLPNPPEREDGDVNHV